MHFLSLLLVWKGQFVVWWLLYVVVSVDSTPVLLGLLPTPTFPKESGSDWQHRNITPSSFEALDCYLSGPGVCSVLSWDI
jgi:hypothetical protein